MDREQLKHDLECIAGQRSLKDDETMVSVLRRLDTCGQSPEIEDRLKHYLSKRSYIKALEWLENPETPHRQ